MGMYTRLALWVGVDDEAAADIQLTLQSQTWGGRRSPLLGSSYSFITAGTRLVRDLAVEAWYLTVDGSIKNYDGEIDAFLTWIEPHVKAYDGDFVGFTQYEDDEAPTLLYWQVYRNARSGRFVRQVAPPPAESGEASR